MMTAREDGFRMPPEWGPHQAALMAWPTRTREAFWGPVFEQAKEDYASVARAIAAFEPVIMACNPGEDREVRDRCGAGVEPLEIPIDDSWMRDNGPIFVTDQRGNVAMVHFRFNAWGGKYPPWDRDAAAPKAIAAHLGVRRYEAPFVLEGGAFLLETPTDPSNHNYNLAPENVRRLSQATDARGRPFQVLRFEPTGRTEVAGMAVEIPYLNCYLANAAVIMPTAGAPQDEEARARIAEVFPDREVVCVPGAALEYGGGGPHCITQQVPAGTYVR